MGWQNVELFAVPPFMRSQLYAVRPSWWERVEYCRVLTVPSTPVLAYYTNLVVEERPGAARVWNTAAIEFITMALVRFLHASECGVVGFQCYVPWMSQGGCGVLVPIWCGALRHAYN